MKVVAIIQARMGSTRLPGKVLMDLAGEPMLARVVCRVGRARTLDAVIVATTVESADEAIERLCEARGWPCYRGSRDDVLDRYYQAARRHAAEAVVRVTADCPLVDPTVVDRVVAEFLRRQPGLDYASNGWPRMSFPRGLDTEVLRFDALERAWREDNNPAWREHVTPYLYQHPETFRLLEVPSDADYSHLRWTVDTPEDWNLIERIYRHFGHDRFSWEDVLELVGRHPKWLEVNRHVVQKEMPS